MSKLHQSPLGLRIFMHLSEKMKTLICKISRKGVKLSTHQYRHAACRRDTWDLLSSSGIEQFYDLCPTYKEFHVNNSLPELRCKKRTKVLWVLHRLRKFPVPRPSPPLLSVTPSPTNRLKAGHWKPRSCNSSRFGL